MAKRKVITNESVGVHYADNLDPFKVEAQRFAESTESHSTLGRYDMSVVSESRGESCFLIKTAWGYLAHVEETLGTEAIVADEMEKLTGRSYYHQIGYSAAAVILNDMATSGAQPISLAMHLALSDDEWLKHQRSRDLLRGWADACKEVGCVYGPGETPTLRGVVVPGRILISGSAVGVIQSESRRINADEYLRAGDLMILVGSSGPHDNGFSVCRTLAAERLDNGYMTRIGPKREAFGDLLLARTLQYSLLVQKALHYGAAIDYASNITGHGWQKLMRHPEKFRYVVKKLPKSQPIFEAIQKASGMNNKQMYSEFNMGAGFALFVSDEGSAKIIIKAAKTLGFSAWVAGWVEKCKRGEEKQVFIKPLDLPLFGSEMELH